MKIKTIIIVILSFVTQLHGQYSNSLWSWSGNFKGELGLGYVGDLLKPENTGFGTEWKIILHHRQGGGIGLKKNGTLWKWGFGISGSENNNSEFPIQIGKDTDWSRVAIGGLNIFAIKTNGTLWAWGDNSNGIIDPTNNLDVITPLQIGNDKNWSTVTYNNDGNSVFGIKTDGTLWAWGDNSFGQLGIGNTLSKTSPQQIGNDTNWHSCYFHSVRSVYAIKTDGTLWAWGNGYLGLGISNPTKVLIPTQVGVNKNWKQIYNMGFSAIALKSNGTLWAWGVNNSGELGLGNKISPQISPIQIGTDSNWNKIFTDVHSFDGPHVIVQKQNGGIWTWGNNQYGQLGSGDTKPSTIPVPIGTDINWSNCISMGGEIYALKNDGSFWLWGNVGRHYSPKNVQNDFNCKQTYTGHGYSYALKSNGTLWSWGYNDSGQLGLGDRIDRNKPMQIGNDSDWNIVSLGRKHVIAIKTNGTLWAWGSNQRGQLGIGYPRDTIIFSPIQIGIEKNWKSSSCGSKTSFAIKKDGTMWGWGYGNQYCGNSFWHLSPFQIGIDQDWNQISAGLDFILFSAIKTNRTIWMSYLKNPWTINERYTNPIQIGKDTNWMYTTAGETKIYSLKNDKTLWYCNNDSLTSFVQIGSDKWNSVEASHTFLTGVNIQNIPYKIDIYGNINQLDSNKNWISISSRSQLNSTYNFGGSHYIGIRSKGQTTNSIKLQLKENPILIYPVPVKDYLNFNMSSIKTEPFAIFNISGRLILSGKCQNQIDVSQLNPGIYFLRTNVGNFKFIKE